jgi:hypothetical protein
MTEVYSASKFTASLVSDIVHHTNDGESPVARMVALAQGIAITEGLLCQRFVDEGHGICIEAVRLSEHAALQQFDSQRPEIVAFHDPDLGGEPIALTTVDLGAESPVVISPVGWQPRRCRRGDNARDRLQLIQQLFVEANAIFPLRISDRRQMHLEGCRIGRIESELDPAQVYEASY